MRTPICRALFLSCNLSGTLHQRIYELIQLLVSLDELIGLFCLKVQL